MKRKKNNLFEPRLYPPIIFLVFWTAAGLFFGTTAPLFWLIIPALLILLCFEAPLWLWLAFALPLSFLCGEFYYGQPYPISSVWPESLKHLWLLAILAAAWGAFALARPYLLSLPVFLTLKKKKGLFSVSSTEKEALEAGEVWMEGEFFKSWPDFQSLFSQTFPGGPKSGQTEGGLTEEEKSFLKKETSDLCEISSEWEIISSKKFPETTEEALKKQKFWGMIIPKKYGGREFSPLAHARVIEKIASVNLPAAVVAMVPNSLGPAELLLHYGTFAQKKRYLKKLAAGEEIPCLGLTEPQAGSDAASISSEGILFRGKDGRLKIRLNWSKRWITLAPKATLIGLAFQLKDPEGLLPEGAKTGITCALVPASRPGVETGLYHDSAGLPFFNGPMKGSNVVVDAEEAIIGGLKQAGRGWKMLMECLAAGRAVSIPSLCIGSGARISRLTSAHARIRSQFGRPIGKFEALEEPLARIAGRLYLMKAAQDLTLSALNQGLRPPIAAAITKYNLTELARNISSDGMDVMAGAGISLGPKNMIGNLYRTIPITVTVEGANILTRTFITYGQGIVRAHPFLRKEIQALESGNFEAFDRLLWKHLYQILCNSLRLTALSLTRGCISIHPGFFGKEHRFIQKLAWSGSLFCLLSNLSLFLGGKLRSKGKLTGRFADMLSHLYIASALIWQWRRRGRRGEEWPAAKWGLDFCFSQMQKAVEGIVSNFPLPAPISFLRAPFLLICRINTLGAPPSDKLSKELAQALLENEDFRESLHSNQHLPKNPEHQLQKLEKARRRIIETEKAREKIRQAAKKGRLPKKRIPNLIEAARKAGEISEKERESLLAAEAARWEAIQVDTFTKEEYLRLK